MTVDAAKQLPWYNQLAVELFPRPAPIHPLALADAWVSPDGHPGESAMPRPMVLWGPRWQPP